MILNGPMALKELFSASQIATQPFFITHSMLDTIGHSHTTELLQFLLCDSFEAECNFGISKNWPTLGDIRVVLPADHRTLYSLPTSLIVPSETLYAILGYFARVLNQQQLIDEIGKTVAVFLLRPEGDSAWLGHNFIAMKLPPFRCKRTLHLAWSCADGELKYPFKTPPYYKLAWMGSIRYMQLSLCANTVLSELGIYSMLQLEDCGLTIPNEWLRRIKRIFWRDKGSSEFNQKIQFVGLRCDWGSIQNRILSSVIILKPQLYNFTRINQWQEWLLFQRLQPDNTWMAGQMAHIKPKTQLMPNRSYNPTLCGINSGLGDIYYRLITENSADIMLLIKSYSAGYFKMLKAHALCSPTGFPLDGQFRHLEFGDEMHTYYNFVPRDEVNCWKIMNKWGVRLKYHWQLSCPQQFFHSGSTAEDTSVFFRSSAYAPFDDSDLGLLMVRKNRETLIQLPDSYEAKVEKVIVYGSPNGDGDHDKVLREQIGLYYLGEEDQREKDRIAQGDPIPATSVYDQKYPIHYCDGIANPTAGDIMARCGIVVTKTTAGVSSFSNYELINLANKMEVAQKPVKYTPHTLTHSESEKVGSACKNPFSQVSREQDSCCNSTANIALNRSIIEEKMKEKHRKKMMEREKHQQEVIKREEERAARMQQVVRSNTSVQISKWKNELRAFAKAWSADLALLEVDPQWQAWDGMEQLNPASTGSTEALTCRYSNILRGYDNRDLIGLLRLAPRIARGELCRVLIHMMEDCTPYITANSRDARIHDKVKNFLSTAMDNLQHCNILTEEELQTQFGCNHLKFNDWHVYGTMTFDNFIAIPMKWTEEAHECTLQQEHTQPPGPGAEGEGRYSGTSIPKLPQNKEEAILDDAAVADQVNKVVHERINDAAEFTDQNFQPVQPSCSAQSPRHLACSPNPNTTQYPEDGKTQMINDTAIALQGGSKKGEQETQNMTQSSSMSKSTLIQDVVDAISYNNTAVFWKGEKESSVDSAPDSMSGNSP